MLIHSICSDDINGTAWEHDLSGTQLRAGGDAQGIVDSLDYLYTMGIRGLYLVGSAMINMPWQSDQYSPMDHTILDHHLGNISVWRSVIDAIHAKGMYVLFDNTMATMANQLMFSDFQNSSAPFTLQEYDVAWKNERHYVDWDFGNEELAECDVPYPRFWDEDGHRIQDNFTASMKSCRNSEFDQYGDIGAFDIAPEWRKQLSKFGGVQDRLREWKPSVRRKIEHFSCMMITALDLDGFRMDKGMQISVDAQGNFSAAMRECAKQHGKHNFFVTGEIVGGNKIGAVYLGRGKEPSMAFPTVEEAFKHGSHLSDSNAETIRERGQNALDSAAFHYPTYRAFVHALGVNGHLTATGDTSTNFADSWAEMVLTNDMSNAYTGSFDPRHLYGVENHDVFKWSGIEFGLIRHGLGAFIVTLVLPGMPMVSWGEEQAFYALDSTAPNYLFGRQPMSSSQAWQMHGCYKVGDNTPAKPVFNSTLRACQDTSINLDHRDQSHPKYNIYRMMFEMRERYPVLNDGWMLQQISNNTCEYTLPDARGAPTEVGLYSVVRSRFSGLQDFSEIGQGNTDVWMLYSNLNYSRLFKSPCDSVSATLAPLAVGTTVKNLFYPFEQYTLEQSRIDSDLSCIHSIHMAAYGYKAFVPIEKWLSPSPHVTKFFPGHDARLLSRVSEDGPEIVPISFEFSHHMDCESVTTSISVTSTTGDSTPAVLDRGTVHCSRISLEADTPLIGAMPSVWTISANLTHVYNGVHVITIENASTSTSGNGSTTNGLLKFMFRIGQIDNPMVFSSANYSSTLLLKDVEPESSSSMQSLYIAHKAVGAELFRYSTNWGSSWTTWQTYRGGNTIVEKQPWTGTRRQQWTGVHVQVQYWSRVTGSSNHLQEGDVFEAVSSKPPRRFPHAFVHGPFNAYGFDAGFSNTMWQDKAGIWNWDLMTEWPAQFQVNIWGINPDGLPDMTKAYGDIDNDTVLDRLSPASLQEPVVPVVNIADMVGGKDMGPPFPYLAWRVQVNDGNLRYNLVPVGSRRIQFVLFVLLGSTPLFTAIAAVVMYRGAFYKIKFNKVGLSKRVPILPTLNLAIKLPIFSEKAGSKTGSPASTALPTRSQSFVPVESSEDFFGLEHGRRTVL